MDAAARRGARAEWRTHLLRRAGIPFDAPHGRDRAPPGGRIGAARGRARRCVCGTGPRARDAGAGRLGHDLRNRGRERPARRGGGLG